MQNQYWSMIQYLIIALFVICKLVNISRLIFGDLLELYHRQCGDFKILPVAMEASLKKLT